MDSILGPIPEAPTISWVPDFVQQCAIKDVEEDLFGDQELMPYDPKQHFNYSIKEISESLHEPHSTKFFTRGKAEFHRNFFALIIA